MGERRTGQETTRSGGRGARRAWVAAVAAAAFWVAGAGLRAAPSKTPTMEMPRATVCTIDAGERQAAERRDPKWAKTQRLLGYVGEVVDVALVDNPPRVVGADTTGRVTIWNRETGLQDVSLPRHEDPVTAVVANYHGQRIAVATSARLTVWDPRTAERGREFAVYKANPATVDMDRVGSLVAARTKAGAVTVWQAHSGKTFLSLADTVGPVAALSLTSNRQLAIAGSTGEAEVWDIRQQRLVFKAPKQPSGIRSVHVSPDGAYLVTGRADGVANIWDVATGASVGQFQAGRTITSVKVKNRGARVLTATGAGRVALRDAKTGHVVRGYGLRGMSVRHIALSYDGRTLAAVGDGYGLWQAGTGRGLPAPGSRHLVAGVALSHDGRRIVAELEGGGCEVLDTTTGRALYDRPPTSDEWFVTGQYGMVLPPGPRVVRVLATGGTIEAGAMGIAVREAVGSKAYRRFDAGPAVTYPYVLSPNETLLLTGSFDGDAHIWEVAAGAHLATLEGHGGRVLSASFDDANRFLATGGMDGAVKVWNPLTGEDLGSFPTRSPGAHAVSLSPGGNYLLAWRREQTGSDGADVVATSQLWDLRTRAEISPPAPEAVHGCAWTTDPAQLYTVARLDGRSAVKSWSPDDFLQRGAMSLSEPWVRPNPAGLAARPDLSTEGRAHDLAFRRSIGLDDPWARHDRERRRKQKETARTGLPVTPSDLPEGGEMLPFDRMHGVRRIAVSRDGSTFAAVTDDGSIDIWRRTDWRPER